MHTKEIEIKIKLSDAEGLVKKVEEMGAKKTSEHTEYDLMYNDKQGTFDSGNPSGKHLRLRKSSSGNILTYKEKAEDGEHAYLLNRTEIQTKIENFEDLDALLKRLGFYVYRIKEKNAVHYELNDFVLQFHKVPFLGDFLEIESDEKNLKAFLPKLGLSIEQGINKGYSALFYDYCEAHNLSLDTPQTFEEEKRLSSRT